MIDGTASMKDKLAFRWVQNGLETGCGVLRGGLQGGELSESVDDRADLDPKGH